MHLQTHFIASLISISISTEETLRCSNYSSISMADLDRYSTSDDVSEDSKGEQSSQESKTDHFSEEEETLITRMYNLVGERWALIAGRIPGRTAEEIEKYWNSRHSTSQ